MTDQRLDNWITNYESGQRQKHTQFLKALKHEFTQRTRQQRRDRLDQINQEQVQGLSIPTSLGRGRTTGTD